MSLFAGQACGRIHDTSVHYVLQVPCTPCRQATPALNVTDSYFTTTCPAVGSSLKTKYLNHLCSVYLIPTSMNTIKQAILMLPQLDQAEKVLCQPCMGPLSANPLIQPVTRCLVLTLEKLPASASLRSQSYNLWFSHVCAGAGAAECLVMLLPHWKMSQLWPLCSSNTALERLESALELVLVIGGSSLSCDRAALTPQQARSVSAALILLQRLTFLSPEAFSFVTGAGMLR